MIFSSKVKPFLENIMKFDLNFIIVPKLHLMVSLLHRIMHFHVENSTFQVFMGIFDNSETKVSDTSGFFANSGTVGGFMKSSEHLDCKLCFF